MSEHRSGQKPLIAVVGAVLVAVIGLWAGFGGPDRGGDADPGSPGPTSRSSQAANRPSRAASSVDPESGLAWVDEAALPPEAGDTLALIDAGGPFPYDEDGSRFGNYEGVLPDEPRDFYREYTVETPGLGHRGPLRIVTGGEGGPGEVRYYWTQDHYESFQRIRRGPG